MSTLITLRSGHKIDLQISGAQDCFPLVFLHGTPGAKPPISSLARVCAQKKLKLITFSRAGYGESTRRGGRSIGDEAAVVEEIVQHLGHQKYYVGGWSGGGPHALACAAKSEGCAAALIVASVAPYDAEGLDWMAGQGQDNLDETNASLQGEAALREFVNAQRPDLLKSDVKALVDAMITILPKADKTAMLENDEVASDTIASFHEALKHGTDGWVDDDLAFISPWGFDVGEVKCPVLLWQGSEDLMVPFGHGKWISEHLPKKYLTKHLQEGHGHISIFMGQVEEMVGELIAVGK